MGLISSAISASKIKDTTGLKKQINAKGNRVITANSNDALMKQWGSNPGFETVKASDLLNGSAGEALASSLGQIGDAALGGLADWAGGAADSALNIGATGGSNGTNDEANENAYGGQLNNKYFIGGLISGALSGIGTGIGALIGGIRAKKEAARLNELQAQASIKERANFTNAAQNLDTANDARALTNYAALGGYIGIPSGDGALGYNLLIDNIENDKLNQLSKEKSIANLGNSYFNTDGSFADGGFLFDNNGFTNGVRYINTGGTHEANPNEGVPVGVAPDGKLNLVEEGETIYNDYVFSDRIKVPKKIKKLYKLGGNIETFSDTFKFLSKESEEMPNDIITKNGLDKVASDLMNEQEAIKQRRQKRQQRKLIAKQLQQQLQAGQYARGGHLYSGYDEEENAIDIDKSFAEDNNVEFTQPVDVFSGDKFKGFFIDDFRARTPKGELARGFYKPGEQPIVPNPDTSASSANWGDILRYSAPLLAGALGIGFDAAGLTNVPTTYNRVPEYKDVSFKPIGNYLTYTPFDTTYALNRAEAQANATRRALMQSNNPSRNAAILAADYNAIGNQGELFRKAQEANLAQRLTNEEFNRKTNEINSEGLLKADLANREALLANAQLALQEDKLNEDSLNNAWKGRAANIDNLLGSIAGIGSEMNTSNRINFLIKSGAFGALSEEQLRDLRFPESQIKEIKGKDYVGKKKKKEE